MITTIIAMVIEKVRMEGVMERMTMATITSITF
jgi:hypothetical protein